MMNCVFKTMNCVFKTRNCVLKTGNCALKMMNLAVYDGPGDDTAALMDCVRREILGSDANASLKSNQNGLNLVANLGWN